MLFLQIFCDFKFSGRPQTFWYLKWLFQKMLVYFRFRALLNTYILFWSVNNLQGSYIFLHCYQQLLTLHISSRCKAPLYWEPPSIWHHYHHRQQHTVAGWIVGIHCHSTVVLFGNSFLSWRLVLDFNESQEPHRSIIQWRWVYLNKIFWSNRQR